MTSEIPARHSSPGVGTEGRVLKYLMNGVGIATVLALIAYGCLLFYVERSAERERWQRADSTLDFELYHDVIPVWWWFSSRREQFVADLRQELERAGWQQVDSNAPLARANTRCRLWIEHDEAPIHVTPRFYMLKTVELTGSVPMTELYPAESEQVEDLGDALRACQFR